MNETPQQSRRGFRRILWPVAAIAVAAATYTAGWFYIGGELEAQTESAIARINTGGRRAGCEKATVHGFPFRIGLSCDSVLYEDAAHGLSVSAGPMRSAAPVYNPWSIAGDLQGPAHLELPGLVPLRIDWDRMHSRVRIDQPLPRTVSALGVNVRASPAGEDAATVSLVSARSFRADMKTEKDSLDLAVSATALDIADGIIPGGRLPPFDAAADLTVDDGVALTASRSLRGRSGTIRSASADIGAGAGFTVSGPYRVNADGLVDANLSVTVRQPAKLSELLAASFPEIRKAIEQNGTLAVMLAAAGDAITLPLVISRSRPVFAFVALNPIPPLP